MSTHRNDSVVSGRYDLWLLWSDIGVPQKSFLNTCNTLLPPFTSLFDTIAGMSSCTNSPFKLFAYVSAPTQATSVYTVHSLSHNVLHDLKFDTSSRTGGRGRRRILFTHYFPISFYMIKLIFLEMKTISVNHFNQKTWQLFCEI